VAGKRKTPVKSAKIMYSKLFPNIFMIIKLLYRFWWRIGNIAGFFKLIGAPVSQLAVLSNGGWLN